MTVANGHRTTHIPELDGLPEPAPLDGPFKTPVTDALRAAPFGPMTPEGLERVRAEPPVKGTGPEALASDRRGELAHWWHKIADMDLEMLLPKAVEYSAHDLRMTGHVLADMMGIEVDDAFACELACATYLMSKVTRILGAYKEGRLPSVDSITDARVYATMMARVREKGGWPGWESAI